MGFTRQTRCIFAKGGSYGDLFKVLGGSRWNVQLGEAANVFGLISTAA